MRFPATVLLTGLCLWLSSFGFRLWTSDSGPWASGGAMAQEAIGEKVIAGFEDGADLKLIELGDGARMTLSTARAKAGKQSLKVSLPPGEYPGFTVKLKDPDWSGYKFFRVRVYSPIKVGFAIRVDDVNSRNYATRFNYDSAELLPGWNLFQIPLSTIEKKIDVRNVKLIVMFLLNSPEPVDLYVDDIALGEKLNDPANEPPTPEPPPDVAPTIDLTGIELEKLLDFEVPETAGAASAVPPGKCSLSAKQVKSGKSSLEVELPKGANPSVTIVPPRKDWRGFDLLLAWVYSEKPLRFALRLDDEYSSDAATRFTRDNLALGRGWNPISVELSVAGAAVELDSIRSLAFSVPDCPGATLYIDDLCLGRRPQKAAGEQVLFAFEDEAELGRIESDGDKSLSNEKVKAGQKSLKVTLPAGPWPGIRLNPPITDWSPYTALRFDVWSPRTSGFGIRMDDANSRDYNSRYNAEGVILAGWNTYQVDLRKVKPINPAKMRVLVLFLLGNPEPTTLYFDNVRLGAYDENIRGPIPGEEGPKRDIEYSTKVETPHRKWAKPTPGGKVRVFAIPSIADGRDLAELMQRMDLDVTAVSIDPNWDTNCWGIGDYYGRGEQNDYRLVYKYVEDELTSKKEFDALILPTPTGWTDFSAKTRDAILRRVKHGAGCVFVYPFMTSTGKKDERLWAISPLTEVLDNSLGGGDYLAINWGAIAGGEWKPAQPHYILRGVPFELLPSRNLQHFRYKAVGTVIAQAGGDPLIGVKEYGRGRVVTFAWQNSGFTPPAIDPAATGITWDYWEYYYNLLVRAVMWAAKREGTVAVENIACDGKALSLEVSVGAGGAPAAAEIEVFVKNQWAEDELQHRTPVKLAGGRNAISVPLELKNPACGLHIVDVILRADGKSMDWGSTSFAIARPASILSVRVPQLCPEKDPLAITVTTDAALATDAVRLEVEDQQARVVYQSDKPAGPEVTEKAVVSGALSRFVRVVAELRRGETLLDRKVSKDVYIVPADRAPRQYRAELGWAGGWKSYFFPTINRLIADRETDIGPIGRAFLDNGIGAYGLGFGRYNSEQYSKQRRLYFSTHEKGYLIRDPCLSSPEYRTQLTRNVAQAVAQKAKYRLGDYFVVDEGSLTSYGDAFDFCFSPHCLARFRKWLEEKYKDLDTLNEVWGTDFEEWDKVEPLTTEEARQKGNWGPWGDHRLFMAYVYADTFRLIRETVRENDPDGNTVVSGTQTPNPWNACDWSELDDHIDHISCYAGGDQWEVHRSFKPGALIGTWTGYGACGVGVKHAMWSFLFHCGTQPRIFWGYSFLNPDLTYSRSAFDLGEVFRAIKDSGLDRVVLEGKRVNYGIAIHYSFPSILASEALGRGGASDAARSAWVRLVHDIGLQFDFVSAPQIERGVLRTGGYCVLILPESTALSDKEVSEITAFVKAGGMLIADVQAGLMRENCAVRREPAWKELGETLVKGSLKPAEKVAEPKVVSLEKGKLVHLGYTVDAYPALRGNNFAGDDYRTMLRQTLAAAGVKPIIELDGPIPDLPYAETTAFQLGSTVVLSVLREPTQVKTIKRPDGTVSFEGEDQAGVLKAKFRLPGVSTVTTIFPRSAASQTPGGGVTTVELLLRAGEPAVIALFPEKPGARPVSKLDVQAPASLKPGEVLHISGKTDAAEHEPRVFTLRFSDPTGKPHRLYYRSIFSKTNAFVLDIPLAFNDPTGEWKLEVTDVLSGITIGKAFVVR